MFWTIASNGRKEDEERTAEIERLKLGSPQFPDRLAPPPKKEEAAVRGRVLRTSQTRLPNGSTVFHLAILVEEGDGAHKPGTVQYYYGSGRLGLAREQDTVRFMIAKFPTYNTDLHHFEITFPFIPVRA